MTTTKTAIMARPISTLTFALMAALTGACGDSKELANAEGYMPEDLPPWTCDTDASSGGGSESGCGDGTGEVDECRSGDECQGGYCVASFNGDIGVFACRQACIPSMDESQWCADASACCEANARCERGYCIVDAASETGAAT